MTFIPSREIISGEQDFRLPNWGRAFWQDPNDGYLFVAFTSGNYEVDYSYSSDGGLSWSEPEFLFPMDDFNVHQNFDVCMDRRGHIHCAFRYKNINCYRTLGRVPGSGYTHASGIGVQQLQQAGDSGNVKGFQGSIVPYEVDVAFSFSGPPEPHPSVLIAAKGSGVVDDNDTVEVFSVVWPYTSSPTLWESVATCGTDGGYPIVYSNFGSDFPGVTFYNDDTKEIQTYASFGSFFADVHVPVGSGRNPFGEHMAFGSGINRNNNVHIVVASASGQDMYACSKLDNFGGKQVAHIESLVRSTTTTWRDDFSTNNFGIQGPQGTQCDVSINDNRQTILYFVDSASDGSQCINRIIGTYLEDVADSGRYVWSSLDAPGSGLTFHAKAPVSYAGGLNNKTHYLNFKALQHPADPKVGISKKEMLVTSSYKPFATSGTTLASWSISEGAVNAFEFPFPDFLISLLESTAFSGILDSSGFTGTLENLFDGDSSTSATLSSAGGHITFGFNSPVKINRFDFWRDNAGATDWGTISISGSFGEDLQEVFTSTNAVATRNHSYIQADRRKDDAGFLIREHDKLDAPIACTLLRFAWTGGASSVNIHNIRASGPGGLKQINNPFETDAYIYEESLWQPEDSRETEYFRHTHNNVPAGWNNTGAFQWQVDASGDFAKINGQLAPAVSNGTVQGGFFDGDPNGKGDGFALVTRNDNVEGNKGIVTVDIDIYSYETASFGQQGRTVSFFYRADLDDNDIFRFKTSQDGISTTRLTVSNNNPVNYTFVDFDVESTGNFKLTWEYENGASTSGDATRRVWIDTVKGLNGSPQPSIRGFAKGVYAAPTGSIHGYLEGKGHTQIHGYTIGGIWSSSIHGYTRSQVFPDAVESVHGYVLAETSSKIHGYTLGASGVVTTSYPTGSIHGYIAGAKMWHTEQIHGFVKTMFFETIHGYTKGHELASFAASGDNLIHGFVLAKKPNESIHGYVLGRRPDQAIHGYVVAPIQDFNEKIHGYALAKKPFESIHGYVLNSGAISSIHGYAEGTLPGQFIHGYVKRPKAPISKIHGYTTASFYTNESIHGYTQSAFDYNESIHAFTSGAFRESSEINGYLMSISGTFSEEIHGYAAGHILQTEDIWGFLVGLYPSGTDVCTTHLFPIPVVDSGTYPTGIIFNKSV